MHQMYRSAKCTVFAVAVCCTHVRVVVFVAKKEYQFENSSQILNVKNSKCSPSCLFISGHHHIWFSKKNVFKKYFCIFSKKYILSFSNFVIIPNDFAYISNLKSCKHVLRCNRLRFTRVLHILFFEIREEKCLFSVYKIYKII